MMIPRLHTKYIEEVRKANDQLKSNGTVRDAESQDARITYEQPLISQIQSITKGLLKDKTNFLRHEELIKELQTSRNRHSALKHYNSTNTLRKIRTSQARIGGLTSRGSNLRPTTGLGLVSESTYDSGATPNEFSKTSQASGFKFAHNKITFKTPAGGPRLKHQNSLPKILDTSH